MKRIFTLLSFILFTGTTNYSSGNDTDAYMIQYFSDFIKKTKVSADFKNSLDSAVQSFHKKDVSIPNFHRALEWDAQQTNYTLAMKGYIYTLNVLERNTKPFFYSISRNDSVLHYEVLNRQELDSVISLHKEKYGQKLDITNSESFPVLVYTYESGGCGFSGELPAFRHKLVYNVIPNSSSKYKVLAKWIRSYNPEVQLYGAEGIVILALHGRVKIRKADVELIRHIVTRNIRYNTCWATPDFSEILDGGKILKGKWR